MLPYERQMVRQITYWEEPHIIVCDCICMTALGAPRVYGGLSRCVDLWWPLHVFFAPNSAPLPSHLQFYHCWLSHYLISWWGESFVHLTITFQKVMGVIKTTSWHHGTSSLKQQLARSDIAKDCLLTLVKNRLALGSPGCLFVTMPKMGQYTGKWLLLSP